MRGWVLPIMGNPLKSMRLGRWRITNKDTNRFLHALVQFEIILQEVLQFVLGQIHEATPLVHIITHFELTFVALFTWHLPASYGFWEAMTHPDRTRGSYTEFACLKQWELTEFTLSSRSSSNSMSCFKEYWRKNYNGKKRLLKCWHLIEIPSKFKRLIKNQGQHLPVHSILRSNTLHPLLTSCLSADRDIQANNKTTQQVSIEEHSPRSICPFAAKNIVWPRNLLLY